MSKEVEKLLVQRAKIILEMKRIMGSVYPWKQAEALYDAGYLSVQPAQLEVLRDDEIIKIELRPVVVEGEPNSYIIRFGRGVQSFTLDNYWEKEEAETMCKFLMEALRGISQATIAKNSKAQLYRIKE